MRISPTLAINQVMRNREKEGLPVYKLGLNSVSQEDIYLHDYPSLYNKYKRRSR